MVRTTKVGFTGTQEGATTRQLDQVRWLLQWFQGSEFHHGDCIGADCQAAILASAAGYTLVVHPPLVSTKRAFVPGHVVLEPKPYLDRNKDIVHASDVMLATPKEICEVLRSGTWSTIRYAQKLNKPLHVLYPDGSRVDSGY